MRKRSIILFSPDIPQNAGNIARTCAITNTKLILVRPLGFNLSKKEVKRAGLDYWDDVDLEVVDDLESLVEEPIYFFSTKGTKIYTEPTYEKNCSLVFGSESSGLPDWVHEKWPQNIYTIPMLPKARSLNLANSVSIVLYEALRQQNFAFE